jgi:hypothetical protein
VYASFIRAYIPAQLASLVTLAHEFGEGGLELAHFDGINERDTATIVTAAASSLPPSHEATHARPPDSNISEAASASSHRDEELSRSMSRSPLLLRSSPAFGTGSFGATSAGFPLHHDEETTDDEHDNTHPRHTIPKGKSGLRRTFSVIEAGHDAIGDYEGNAAQPGRHASHRRRSTPGASRHSIEYETLRASIEGDDTGIGTRFTGSALPGFAAGPSAALEGILSNDGSVFSDDDDEGSYVVKVTSGKSANGAPPADDSPYAQVRASVPPYDNTTLSINTPRMWILSIVFSIFGSATNLFFSLRYPSVSITPVIALLIVHPVGLLWDRTLKRSDDPTETFVNGSLEGLDLSENEETSPRDTSSSAPSNSRWTRRLRIWLAQGRWNEKEHSCVFISSNVSFGFAFATDVCSLFEKIGHAGVNISIGDCGTNKILQPRSRNHVSDSSHTVHADLRLRPRWTYSSFSGAP